MRRLQTDQDLFDELAAERLGVNRTDLRVMDVLQREGPLTAGTLAGLSGLSRPALTTAIDRLERAGYARRTRSGADRRQVRVELTRLLHDRVAEIWGPISEEVRDEFAPYTRAELELVRGFLEAALRFSERHRQRLSAERED